MEPPKDRARGKDGRQPVTLEKVEKKKKQESRPTMEQKPPRRPQQEQLGEPANKRWGWVRVVSKNEGEKGEMPVGGRIGTNSYAK